MNEQSSGVARTSLSDERGHKRRFVLIGYDIALFILAELLMVVMFAERFSLNAVDVIVQICVGGISVLLCRYCGGIYRHIWRYSSTWMYIRLILLDFVAGWCYYILQRILPIQSLPFFQVAVVMMFNLLLVISARLVYQFLYEYSSEKSRLGKLMRGLVHALTGIRIEPKAPERLGMKLDQDERRINIAIVGAGRVGSMLAEDLQKNPHARCCPCCFIDVDKDKIGRYLCGLRIMSEEEATQEVLDDLGIQEVVFALPEVAPEKKKELYERYKQRGYRVRVYDFPTTRAIENGKRQMREFDIEELLFRPVVNFIDEQTCAYYRDKVVLVSGGGGSIGSELCRQLAKLELKKLVILDVYENGAYDIQQELRLSGRNFELVVEIVSVCDRESLDRIFALHKPNIVLHAAAHKHVPLMERNCCEAVRNNVFGTLNIVEIAEKHGVEKFTMISTDKAVNPTNVMGATKRMCELIVQSKVNSATNFSATRFGNVLGSNGSVIPLFKRQIMNGGPVTITDKRIIRYFMTIPEASQLVLQSGAMAKHGELYVLDMGKPVRILELAENMIRLAGYEPYQDIDIVEVGLRPGEKLYEELLIRSEEQQRTSNSKIFVERDKPRSEAEIAEKLELLHRALAKGDEKVMKATLKQAVETYVEPGVRETCV